MKEKNPPSSSASFDPEEISRSGLGTEAELGRIHDLWDAAHTRTVQEEAQAKRKAERRAYDAAHNRRHMTVTWRGREVQPGPKTEAIIRFLFPLLALAILVIGILIFLPLAIVTQPLFNLFGRRGAYVKLPNNKVAIEWDRGIFKRVP